jgi:hypothetical protein
LRPASAAVLVWPSRADLVLVAAGLGQADVDVIDIGMLAEATT